MLKTDQFWQYAKEAVLLASYAQTDEEKGKACSILGEPGRKRR
jgi:hypothetical protein